MYIQEEEGTVYFRLWNSDDPELWTAHGWIPYEAVKQAIAMYEPKNPFNPKQAYDLQIARALLKD